MDSVSIIIPAHNEQSRIETTLRSLQQSGEWFKEIIVVDDGSSDETYTLARKWTPHVLRLEQNQGKAKAIELGCAHASQSIYLFLDADLETSAGLAIALVEPIWQDKADMTVAIFPPALNGGFGLVKRLAKWGIYKKTGIKVHSPLCGQRAVKKEVYQFCYQGDRGFGIEVGLTLDFLLAGYQVQEIEIPFQHRETGKNVAGFYHRLKQGIAIGQALLSRR